MGAVRAYRMARPIHRAVHGINSRSLTEPFGVQGEKTRVSYTHWQLRIRINLPGRAVEHLEIGETGGWRTHWHLKINRRAGDQIDRAGRGAIHQHLDAIERGRPRRRWTECGREGEIHAQTGDI